MSFLSLKYDVYNISFLFDLQFYNMLATLSMFAIYNRAPVGTEFTDYLADALVNFNFDALRK